jgi:hypothetical protein
MTAATDTNIREIKDLITGLREEMRVGFANIDTKFATSREETNIGFAELRRQINTVEAKLEGKIDQLDERTKLGFWGFIFRGTALAALAALTVIFVKYLLPILPPAPPG